MRSRHVITAFYMGILAAFLNAAHAVAALNMEIIPAAPRYQEPVVARLLRPALNCGVIYGATTSMQGNTITVVYYDYPELSSASHDVLLGQLPAGTYTVQLKRFNDGSAIEATAQFTVGGAPVPSTALQRRTANSVSQFQRVLVESRGRGMGLTSRRVRPICCSPPGSSTTPTAIRRGTRWSRVNGRAARRS